VTNVTGTAPPRSRLDAPRLTNERDGQRTRRPVAPPSATGRVARRAVNPIYLDYNATTPLDAGVVEAMQPFLQRHFGNPSSAHEYGRPAREALEQARGQVALLLGADPGEIVFTGSGSEATNLALKGLVFAALATSPIGDLHVVTSAVEHPATLETCRFLQRLGCRVTIVRVDRHGVVDRDALRAALSQPTLAVSVMHANNEVGTLEPIREVAELAHEHGALLHTDAAQSAGKIGVDVRALGADLLTLAGHKLTPRRASRRSTWAKEYRWSRSCTGAARNASTVLAPRTSPTRSDSEPRARSRSDRCPSPPTGSPPCLSGSGSASRPRWARASS
jgi:Aminotransferase class-V